MSKIKKYKTTRGEAYAFTCPACELPHSFDTNPAWNFNGRLDKPTLKPNLIVKQGEEVCQFTLEGGTISFGPESTHRMKGQKIELPEIM